MPEADTPRNVKSPCVGLCRLDLETKTFCAGCFRTRGEIGNWWYMDDEERDRIMAELPARKEAHERAKQERRSRR